jgi:hypothetical protein
MNDESKGGDGIPTVRPDEVPHVETQSAQPDKEPTLSERIENMREVLVNIGQPEHATRFVFFSEQVQELEKGTLTTEEKSDLMEKIQARLSNNNNDPIRRENLEQWIDEVHPELQEEEHQALKQELLLLTEPMTEDEKGKLGEPPPPTPAEEIEMEKERERIAKETQSEMKAIDEDNELTEQEKTALKNRVGSTLERLKGLFAPGEAGKVWTKRLGKGLGYTALAIAIALLAYMKMIHTISRRK